MTGNSTFTAMITTILAIAVFVLVGCDPASTTGEDELVVAKQTISKQEKQLTQLKQSLSERDKTIATLQSLGSKKRLSTLFTVTEIKILRYTSAVSINGKGIDNAIRVRISPLDRAGSALKAAGDVKIRLFDLAGPADKNLLAEFEFPASKIGEKWAGHFGAYHFTFECPFPKDMPACNEITVRVEFTDYLTGDTFNDQTTCTVNQ